MTKTATLLALACFLMTGAAAVTVLARNGLPAVGVMQLAADQKPISNRAGKADKLPVATAAAAVPSLEQDFPELREPLRLALAAAGGAANWPAPVPDAPVLPTATAPATDEPSSSEAAAPLEAATPIAVAPLPMQRPKLAAKPPAPKPYTLLSDEQIAAIKSRLKLSSSQEYYWPSVEQALRAVARKIHASRHGKSIKGAPPIDPDSEEVQQLKSAAMPLLFQLREDQKQEVRSLARIIGLHQVAAQI
ncbi:MULTISPECIES: hypothetical protein [Rhodopseudomonas]|uniref:Uncharacterized protein n=1 Tax=Rhodopseudomonas palustris TaxID=1076 RepID=A0A0D7DX26_RHOPL|nr:MULTISPECIES: hypothetical protein [Rhodopseudomonas]KIZ33148.1 hypothetical protein OO17_28815 [Rhodopseudomonas palustris]MDF3812932.1 hypothetical protein [Rhodopseudomonas sp. BAL398]WOK16015.1 hypothetical protein RBJ75_17790 [Rhodopseudomonas sp. BAL398]